MQIESEDVTLEREDEKTSVVYFSVFSDFLEPITYRVKWKDTSGPWVSFWEFAAVPLVICMILIVAIVLGVAVALWKRRRDPARIGSEDGDPRAAVLLEDIQDHPGNIPTDDSILENEKDL
jgi:hypothetical protein